MKLFVRKFFYLATLMCFGAILLAFVATAGHHRFAEENTPSELTEVEECKALREQEELRNSRKDEPRSLCQTTLRPSSSSPQRPCAELADLQLTERRNLNGFGGFLRT